MFPVFSFLFLKYFLEEERGEDPMAVRVAPEAASQYCRLSRVTMVAGRYTRSDVRHGKSKIRGNPRNNKA